MLFSHDPFRPTLATNLSPLRWVGLSLTLWLSAMPLLARNSESKAQICPAKPELVACLDEPKADECNAAYELFDYLDRMLDEDRPTLAFDHLNEVWVAGMWKESEKRLDYRSARFAEFDVNCEPQLSLPGRKVLLVVVFNTNPLLYSVNPSEVEEFEPEALARLQQLAGLLGGGLQAVVAAADGFSATLAGVPPLEDPTSPIAGLMKRLGARVVDIRGQTDFLLAAQDQLTTDLQATETNAFRIRSIQRAIEDQSPPDSLVQQVAGIVGMAGKIDAAAIAVAKAREAAKTPSCVKGYRAAAGAIEFRLRGSDEKQMNAFLENLDLLRNRTTLGLDLCENDEIGGFGRLAQLLRSWDPTGGQNQVDGLMLLAESYGLIVETFESALKQVAELLAKVPAAAKWAAQLAALRDRELETVPGTEAGALCPGQPCASTIWRLSTGVLPVLNGDPRLVWDRGQKRPFTVAVSARALFADEIVKQRKDKVETEYRLRHRFFADFGIGFAITHTDIVDPVYEAVTNPLDPTKKVIARTDEKSRSGQPALFFSYPVAPFARQGRFRLGAEVGAGLDTDQPSFFGGLSLGFGKYVRLGVGWSLQEVSVLADDQHELLFLAAGQPDPTSLTVVSGNDDIRTRDDFVDDFYISLTIALDSLPFFNPSSE